MVAPAVPEYVFSFPRLRVPHDWHAIKTPQELDDG